jgi:hypothetical protein
MECHAGTKIDPGILTFFKNELRKLIPLLVLLGGLVAINASEAQAAPNEGQITVGHDSPDRLLAHSEHDSHRLTVRAHE